MTRRSGTLVSAWLTLAAVSCGGSAPDGWYDVRAAEYPLERGDVVASAGDFSVVLGEGNHDATAPVKCLQTVIRGIAASACVGYEAGSHGVALRRIDELRYVEIRSASGDVHRFVLWSNLSPNGHVVEPLVAGNERILYWPMEQGEHPWGVQAVDDAGRLEAAWSLPELPDE